MKKVDITDYEVDGTKSNGEKEKYSVKVKMMFGHLLLHPNLKLNGRSLLEASKLVDKIDGTDKPYLLLEDAEHTRLVTAIDAVTGLGKNEVELVKRILEAPDFKLEAVDDKP